MIVSLCTEFPRTGRQFHFATIHIKKYGAANVLQICTFHMFRTVQLGKFFFREATMKHLRQLSLRQLYLKFMISKSHKKG